MNWFWPWVVTLVVAIIGVAFMGNYVLNHAYPGPQCWEHGQKFVGNLTIALHIPTGTVNMTVACLP